MPLKVPRLEKGAAIEGGKEMFRFMKKLQTQRLIHVTSLAGAMLTAGIILAPAPGATVFAGENNEFNEKGNIVIADQFNNRVVEIDSENHKVVWHFGNGSDKPGPHSLVGINNPY